MPIVNVKSQVITDLDAVPVVKTNQLEKGGKLRYAAGVAEFAASDATSVARVIRVNSATLIDSLKFASDDLGTGGTVDIGLYRTEADGGAVVDADFFASAVDTDTAAVALTDITYESAVVIIDNRARPIWQQLNLSADPRVDYDITVTRNSAQGTGTVFLKLAYVEGESPAITPRASALGVLSGDAHGSSLPVFRQHPPAQPGGLHWRGIWRHHHRRQRHR